MAGQEEPLAPPQRENSETPAPDVTAHESCQPIPPHVPGLDLSAPVYIPKSPATSIPVQQQESVIPTVYSNEDSAPAPSTNQIMNSPSITTDPNLVQSQLSAIAKGSKSKPLPLPELGTFSGNPLQYSIWIKAFETLIEGRAINPGERLHFLGKYVSGEAKEVVSGFMLLDGEDVYKKAKKILAKRFGDPFSVATAFWKKLDEWKPIVPYDAIGLRRYADFLIQCEKGDGKSE